LYILTNEISELLNQSAVNKPIKLRSEIPLTIIVDADKDMLSTIIRNSQK